MRIKVNTNKLHVQKIREELAINDGYCPCRIDKTEDTKCICKEFREMEEGMCHCGLYIKEKENGV